MMEPGGSHINWRVILSVKGINSSANTVSSFQYLEGDPRLIQAECDKQTGKPGTYDYDHFSNDSLHSDCSSL